MLALVTAPAALRASSRHNLQLPRAIPSRSASPRAYEMAPSATAHLINHGYVVLDDAFDREEASMLELAMRLIDDGITLAPAEAAGSGRDDAIRFVDAKSAMLPVAGAILRLKSCAEALQGAYAAARAEKCGSAWAAPWTACDPSADDGLQPKLPATRTRWLVAAPEAQLGSYQPSGVYCVHSDNSRDEAGRRRNERALTMIVYANPGDWSEHLDGGCLRIYTDTDEVDCNVGEPAALGDVLSAAPHIDVLPLAGRVVIFRSTLLHEVRGTLRRPRRAITQWFYAPYVSSAV